MCGFLLFGDIFSAQKKKKVNGPEGAKYSFPVEMGIFFLAPYNFGIKNCLIIVGKKLFARPGLLTFFF